MLPVARAAAAAFFVALTCVTPGCRRDVPAPGAMARLRVDGAGQDSFGVFAVGGKKIEHKPTGTVVELPAGDYMVVVNYSMRPIHLEPGGEETVVLGSVCVDGTGVDMYAVFAPDGRRKLQFTRTGQSVELVPGKYVVDLHGVRKDIVVHENGKTRITTGRLTVNHSGPGLYSVFDASGTTRHAFKSPHAETELFPDVYLLVYQEHRDSVTVLPEQLKVLRP